MLNLLANEELISIKSSSFKFKLIVDKNSLGQDRLYKSKKIIHYEKYIIKHYVNKIKTLNKGIIVDCGAYHGFYSILASSINPNLQVYAIEPLKENFKRLKKNNKVNNFQNIKVINIAIGGNNGNAILYKPGNAAHTIAEIGSHLIDNIEYEVMVKQIPLTNLLEDENIDMVDVLKMDIEGAEMNALMGLDLNKVKTIYLEIHPKALEIRQQNVSMIIDLLYDGGFEVLFCPEYGKTLYEIENMVIKEHGYLICEKKEY